MFCTYLYISYWRQHPQLHVIQTAGNLVLSKDGYHFWCCLTSSDVLGLPRISSTPTSQGSDWINVLSEYQMNHIYPSTLYLVQLSEWYDQMRNVNWNFTKTPNTGFFWSWMDLWNLLLCLCCFQMAHLLGKRSGFNGHGLWNQKANSWTSLINSRFL